jgi:hypothetical protein
MALRQSLRPAASNLTGPACALVAGMG